MKFYFAFYVPGALDGLSPLSNRWKNFIVKLVFLILFQFKPICMLVKVIVVSCSRLKLFLREILSSSMQIFFQLEICECKGTSSDSLIGFNLTNVRMIRLIYRKICGFGDKFSTCWNGFWVFYRFRSEGFHFLILITELDHAVFRIIIFSNGFLRKLFLFDLLLITRGCQCGGDGFTSVHFRIVVYLHWIGTILPLNFGSFLFYLQIDWGCC